VWLLLAIDSKYSIKQLPIAVPVEQELLPKSEMLKLQKATEKLDDAWVAEMNQRGFNGKEMLQAARDLVKQFTK